MARVASVDNLEALRRFQQEDYLQEAIDYLVPDHDLPDIVTFAEHPSFLGLPLPLYPRQRTMLRLFFLELEQLTEYDKDVIGNWGETFIKGDPETGDTWGVPVDTFDRIAWLKQNGYDHFREIIGVIGRRGGKNHIGAIMAARQMYKLIRLKNPQLYYGLDPYTELNLFVLATNFQQARDNQFRNIVDMVSAAPCFDRYRGSAKNYMLSLRTPGDFLRIQQLITLGTRLEKEIASIHAAAITSNSRAGRGHAAFMEIFDEFAHMQVGTLGPRTAEEVYQALTPALDQMGRDAMIYEPYSPFTKIGQAFEIYEDALGIDERTGLPLNPELCVVQLPSWGPYEDFWDPEATDGHTFVSAPARYDEQARRIEHRNPDKFRVERRSQWSEVIDAYLRPQLVERMFDPLINPETGEERRLYPQSAGILHWIYRGHADPSKSGANFAALIGHTEPVQERDGEFFYHVFVDWMYVWKPGDFEDHNVDYVGIERDLAEQILAFPTLEVFSYDQYGSFATVAFLKQRLRQARHTAMVKEEHFSDRSNQVRAERFKTALQLDWVHSYRDDFGADGTSLLESELKFLQEKNGKVVPQSIGPVQTKDLADTLMVVTSELLKDQIDRLAMRENLSAVRVAPGAPGGYGTQMEGPPTRRSARAQLAKYRRASAGSMAYPGRAPRRMP